MSRLRFENDASQDAKLKYGFYGEVVLDLILQHTFSSSVLLAKGYFYNPLENSETKGYDAYQFYYDNDQLSLLLGEVKFYASFSAAVKKILDNLEKAISPEYFRKNVLALINQLMKLNFNPTKVDKRKKYAFFLNVEERKNIEISNEPISISAFVHSINRTINVNRMKKLKAVQVTSWLVNNGFLREIQQEDGRKFKVPTELASSIGISSVRKESQFGRIYDVCIYNKAAQQYIIEHLGEILSDTIKIL